MSDFSDLCESLGLDASDPDAIDKIIEACQNGMVTTNDPEIYMPEGNITLDRIDSFEPCDDPSECADCDGNECEQS